MKKMFFLIITLIIVGNIANAQSPNPIVKRLSNQEIAECRTPAAVAYNFVNAILQKDFVKMKSYMIPKIAQGFTDDYIQEEYGEYGISSIEDFFSAPGGKISILTWIPALNDGYEVVIAYVQDLWHYIDDDGSMCFHFNQVVKDGMIYIPGETSPRVGINQKKVYVTCSPSSEVNHAGFQDITRYGGTNVKVLLVQVNGIWKVIGFI